LPHATILSHIPLHCRTILHWSGAHKPISGDGTRSFYRGSAKDDPIELAARHLYMSEYNRWIRRINTTALGETNKDER
jgi:hypothetical protein